MTLAALTLTAVAHAEPRPIANVTAKIAKARDRAHRCQQQLGLEPTPASDRPIVGQRYANWVLALWKARADAYCGLARELGHPVAAIRAVFGPVYAEQALSVSSCETGGTFHVGAQNGQYEGLFQMGSSERARYGHGDTPLEQARAAHAYFVASGKDWSPWQCRPGGGLAW